MTVPKVFAIMQGDQYMIPFSITDNNDRALSDEVIQNVEITIGNIRKTLPDIRYNSDSKVWEFPLYQDESFSFSKKTVHIQVRVVMASGDIMGIDLGFFQIIDSISKEVL